MSRQRLMTYAKGRGIKFDEPVVKRDPAAPPIDRSPMGCARRDEQTIAPIMRGTTAEMQRLAAAINPDDSPERVAYALQQVMIAAANALALAGRLRGINDTIGHFEEETP